MNKSFYISCKTKDNIIVNKKILIKFNLKNINHDNKTKISNIIKKKIIKLINNMEYVEYLEYSDLDNYFNYDNIINKYHIQYIKYE